MRQPRTHPIDQGHASDPEHTYIASELDLSRAEDGDQHQQLSTPSSPPSKSAAPGNRINAHFSFDTEKGVDAFETLRERSHPSTSNARKGSASQPGSVANACGRRGAGSRMNTLRDNLRQLFVTKDIVGPTPTYKESALAMLRYTPLNLCLLCIPVSWGLHYTSQSATLVFVFAALGILPLAALLGFGTEQVALRTSQSIGGLLNATLGNVVELIVAGLALASCDLDLVQSSLLGGLISNLLLVLGMAFVAGGFRFKQQEFQPIVAQLNLSLMTLAVITLLLPAASHELLGDRYNEGEEGSILLQLSRGTSVILLLIYMAYLFFQFHSHSFLFADTTKKPSSGQMFPTMPARGNDIEMATSTSTATEPGEFSSTYVEVLRLNIPFALFLLAGTTGLAYLTSEFLVDALDEVAESAPFSKEFLTLIIIPIITNAAEHTTAVTVASKGKFDLALGVAVGSSIQIALFVIPVLVLAAWGVDKPLTLAFDPMETICLLLSVLLVKFAVEDGKAHWMSGVVLVAAYIVIALSFWNFPDGTRDTLGILCE